MGEINYDFNLLFRDEKRAESLFDEMARREKDCDCELIALINFCCHSDIESHGFNFNISEIRRFRNEVRIPCYTGRSSEMPEEIAGPLCAAGAEIVRMSVYYEDAPDWESIYFVDARKARKKAYDKEFKQFKIEDTTDKLQRLLSSYRFSQAAKLIDEAELDRIIPDEDYLGELVRSPKHTDLAIRLMHAGKFDKPRKDYNDSWIHSVAGQGSTELLLAFLDYGVSPYGNGEPGTNTALHDVVFETEPHWQSNLNLLIERCRNDLSPMTEDGSPLWFGFEQTSNIAACVILQAAGGKVIAPDGYYDNFDRLTTVIEAIKHGDDEIVKAKYQETDYLESLYWALRHQNFDMVKWLNDQSDIDWCACTGDNISTGDTLHEYYAIVPFYEIPFFLTSGGPQCDPRLLEYIVNMVPADKSIYSRLLIYIAGFNDLPEVVPLLHKLIEFGADIDAHFNINGDPDVTCAANQAMLHECLDNMELLLEAGVNTDESSLPDEEPLSGWVDCYAGDLKRQGKALFKKYNVA